LFYICTIKHKQMKTFLITYQTEDKRTETIEDMSCDIKYAKQDFIDNFTDCTFISIKQIK